MANLIEEYTVTDVYVKVKFGPTVKVQSIVNNNFLLNNTDATPSSVSNPFRPISLVRDYNSISKILYLYFADGVLVNNTNYRFTVTNLTDVLDNVFSDASFTFSTKIINIDPTTTQESIYPDPVILDYALADSIFSVPVNNRSNTSILSLVLSNPADNSYYLFEDENNGRIELIFNFSPLEEYLTQPHIKVQRREIKKAPTRWESLNASITLDPDNPIVYIDLPSTDSEDIFYNQPGHTYFQKNYKYRVLLSKTLSGVNNQSTPTIHSMMDDIELIYCGVLDPMYIDIDELLVIYHDAGGVEIAENIHYFSKEVYNLLGLTEEATEIPFIAIEYIQAATACSLEKIYGIGSGFGTTFTLGDLSVSNTKPSAKTVNRGNATSWCELALALRSEILSATSRGGFRSVVRGSKLDNPIPIRRIRFIDSMDSLNYSPDYSGNLDIHL